VAVIVQKFGGTSVADTDKIRAAAKRALDAQSQGHQVVMVVSAMGKSTDRLVDLASELTEEPPSRDMDMLLSTGEQVSVALVSMAIHAMGGKAVSMTGSQLGIATDSHHTKAKILSIAGDQIREKLDSGHIVVACGFQGINEEGAITTLGRGGSDTSAVALAAALRPSQCIIHTDVDGVYTTDPRVAQDASKLPEISFEEMLELAGMGAGVMHSRSIEIGKRYGIPIYVRCSFNENPGSWIYTHANTPRRPVSGAALLRNESRVTVLGVPDIPGAARTVFSGIAKKNVAVDMIVQNASDDDGRTDLSFTVQKGDFSDTLSAAKEAANELGAAGIDFENDVAKISIVGLGMADTPGVAAKMFQTLADAGINILMITTSEIKVSVLVAKDDAEQALQTVHSSFGLHELGASESAASPDLFHDSQASDSSSPAETPDETADRSGEHVEQVSMDAIRLHDGESLISIAGVPDAPGFAARLFGAIAEAGINVDMIVQDAGVGGKANIGFTVERGQLDDCVALLEKLTADHSIGAITSQREIAKLSVAGVGLRSHTDIADRIFSALAVANVNVALINTSEVLINVLVSLSEAEQALEALKREFADVLTGG
jgi:aspartate kinase